MATYLIVKDSVVIDAVVWNGDSEIWSPPQGTAAIQCPLDSSAWIGWKFDGQSFTDPNVE